MRQREEVGGGLVGKHHDQSSHISVRFVQTLDVHFGLTEFDFLPSQNLHKEC